MSRAAAMISCSVAHIIYYAVSAWEWNEGGRTCSGSFQSFAIECESPGKPIEEKFNHTESSLSRCSLGYLLLFTQPPQRLQLEWQQEQWSRSSHVPHFKTVSEERWHRPAPFSSLPHCPHWHSTHFDSGVWGGEMCGYIRFGICLLLMRSSTFALTCIKKYI